MTARPHPRESRLPAGQAPTAAGGAVGLLAGGGRLPEGRARAVRARGRRLVCVQIVGENPALEALADVFARLSLEKWEQLLDLWQRHGVREVLVAGSIRRSDLLARLSGGDAVVRGFLERLPDRRDQSVLDAVAGVLQFLGIRILDQMAYIRDHVPEPGLLAGGPPSAVEQSDVEMGLSVARTLADLDVGQTVVLKQGVILAVEAAEGTDATIRRGGAMTPAAVVVKVSRPRQDPRFDVPTVGPETIESMEAGGGGGGDRRAGRGRAAAGDGGSRGVTGPAGRRSGDSLAPEERRGPVEVHSTAIVRPGAGLEPGGRGRGSAA